MSVCMNYRCFCADSSANIRGVQVLTETLTGIPMLPGAALKMHTRISLIQGSGTSPSLKAAVPFDDFFQTLRHADMRGH